MDCVSLVIQNDYRESVPMTDMSYPFEYVCSFMQDLPYQCTISFFDVNMSNGDDPDFVMNVSRHMTVSQLLERASKHFSVDSQFVRLFRYKG